MGYVCKDFNIFRIWSEKVLQHVFGKMCYFRGKKL